MGIFSDDSWSDIGTTSQTKSSELFDKAVQKQANLRRKKAGLSPQREIQGIQPILDDNTAITYDGLGRKGTDADSAYVTTDEGYGLGIRNNLQDAPEESAYSDEFTVRNSQKIWAAKYYGIDPSRVTDELIYAAGREATKEFNRLASEGQGKLDTGIGIVERSPAGMEPVYGDNGELISGMEPQWYFPEGEITYSPESKRHKGDKRVKVDSLVNPYTGTDVYGAMNTPQYNTRWFDDTPTQNAIREAYIAEHGTDGAGTGNVPSLIQVKPNRKHGFDVFRPKDALNPTHTGFRKNSLSEEDANILAKLAEKHPEASLEELLDETALNASAKFGQSFLLFTGDAAQGVTRPVREVIEATAEFNSNVKEAVKRRFQHGTSFTPKTEIDDKIKNYYFDKTGLSGVNLDRAHDYFLDLSDRSRAEFTAEDTKFYDSFLGKTFQKANQDAVAAKWRAAAASKNIKEGIDAYTTLLDDAVIRTLRHQKEDAIFKDTYRSIAYDEEGNPKNLSYKALGAIVAFAEMYENNPEAAPIDFVTNLPYMAGLVYTGIPGAAALVLAKDEDLVEEWHEEHPGEIQTPEERLITAGSATVAVGAEYFGDRWILRGKLKVLQDAVDKIAVKSNILTKTATKGVEYTVKGGVGTVVEGASGGTTDFAEQYAVEQDLSKIDDIKVSLAAAHEARAGSAGSVIMDAGRDVLPNDVQNNKTKLEKRNEILKDDKLTDKQRNRVVKSRDKIIKNLIGQRHKVKLEDIDSILNDAGLPVEIKKSLKTLISRNELEDTHLESYLDELNTIAQFTNSIPGESGTTIEDSFALLQVLLSKPQEEIEDISLHNKLVAAFQKGINEYNRRAQIDVILAQVNDIETSDKQTIEVLNNARKSAIGYTKYNAEVNIQNIKNDYAELLAKNPEKKDEYIAEEAEAIKEEERILEVELNRLNTSVNVSVDKTKITAASNKSRTSGFNLVPDVDVNSPTYDPEAELSKITDKGVAAIIKDPQLIKNLLTHSKNLKIQINNLTEAGNTEEAELLQQSLDINSQIITGIQEKIEKEKNRTDVVATETQETLFSIDPSELNTEKLNALDNAKLTDDQQELKTLQLKRIEIHSDRADMDVSDVHEEIVFGDTDTKRSFAYYESQAIDGKMDSSQRGALANFVQHMNKKAEVLSKAREQVLAGNAEVIWIRKDDLFAKPIFQAIEDKNNPTELEYESLDDPNKVTSHYKIHKNSGKFIDAVVKEAEYGRVTEQVINKVLDNKQIIAEQNADRFSSEEITEISNLLPSGTTELNLEALSEEDVINNETNEAIQTSPVKVETAETATNLGITKIISGAQTGSDIGGLKASKQLGIETGGTIPKGWKTAEGSKPEYGQEFNLTEDDSSNYVPRTMKNVDNADATIAVIWGKSVGTGKTIGYAQTGKWQYGPQKTKLDGYKPVLVITTKDPAVAAQQVQQFIKDTGAKSLNIAGHREGSQPGIEKFTTDVLVQALSGKSKKSATKEISTNENVETPPVKAKTTEAKLPDELLEKYSSEATQYAVFDLKETDVKLSESKAEISNPGMSILKQYDGKFPDISSKVGEGNITNHFGVKNKKRESIFTLSTTGGLTTDTIKNSAATLIQKLNDKREKKGQKPIETNPMYLEILGNTLESFKADYAEKGPKSFNVKGVPVTESLKAFHVKDSEGNFTLPDEVFLAMAITGLQWLGENSNRLNTKLDDQIKAFLGLESKEKLTDAERNSVIDMGSLLTDNASRLGTQILNALNLKALQDTKYQLTLSGEVVSPSHTQERVETAFGVLALTMLSSVSANTIEKRFNANGPLITMQNVRLTAVPARSNITMDTVIKDEAGNIIDPTEGEFIMDETGSFIDVFVDSKGIARPVSNPINKKTFTTLLLNKSIEGTANTNALQQFIKFIRTQSDQAEALLGYNISKNGVYSNPVLEVQTTIRGSLSKVSSRRQALIKRLQSIPQKGKDGELALWGSLSIEAQRYISGIVDIDTKHSSRNSSYTAANNALEQEIESINRYDNEVFYYLYGVQKQGRMSIKSSGINAMNSKIHRHLVAPKSNPTTVTANDTAMRNIFKIAVAAAFGYSIDKQGAQKSIDNFDDIVNNDVVKAAIDILKDPEQEALHEEAILSVHDYVEVDAQGNIRRPYANKVHLLEGLAALMAFKEGNFKTDITIEIDGITNGFAISLLQFGGENLMESLAQVGIDLKRGEDYGTWLANPNNIDVYFKLAKTMNTQRNSKAITGYYFAKHLDQETGKAKYPKVLTDVMERLTTPVNGFPVVNPNAFLALDRIHGAIEVEGELTKFARDLAKDPLMTTNYSAQLNTVLNKVTKTAIDSMYDKMADIQIEYNTGDKVKAEKQARELSNAIGLFLGFDVGTVDFVNIMKQGELINHTLHASDINKILSAMRYIYEPTLDAGLTDILGKENDTNTLRGRKTKVTQGYEWIYMGYIVAYEAGIKDLGVDNPTREQKREVATSLLKTYYPKYQTAWDDTGKVDTFIDILTSKQVSSTERIKMEYFRPNYPTYHKGAGPLDKFKAADKKTTSSTLSSTEPNSPGAKTLVNMVQGFDADTIGAVSELLEFLTLYDAGIFSIKDVLEGKAIYNDVFINMSKSHSFIEITLKNMKKLEKLLDKDPVKAKAVRERYFKDSHETKDLAKGTVFEEEATLANAISALEDVQRDVKADLRILELLKTTTKEVKHKDGTTEKVTHYPDVNQLNFPDVSKLEQKPDPLLEAFDKDLLFSLKTRVGNDVHRMFYVDGNAKNVSDLFDFFGNRAKKFYHSPEVYAKETKQLGEVVDKLILPAVGILDNLTIEGLSDNTFAHGSYQPGKVKVTVTANKNNPKTYTESTGQEVYVHELVHAITQVGIENDSSIRHELQRIYNYLRKEVTVEDFLDPHTIKSEQAEMEAAQRIYDRVFAKDGGVKRELHELMAYGLTNPALIRKLESLKPVTAKIDLKGKSVLETFHNIIERIVNVFRRAFNGEKLPRHIHDQLFSLATRINTINMDQRGHVAKYLYSKNIIIKHQQANTLLAKSIDYLFDAGAKKTDKYLSKRRQKRKDNPSKSRIIRTLKNIENIPLVGAKLISSKQARDAMEKNLNKVNGEFGKFVRDTLSDLASLTPMQFVNGVLHSNRKVDYERRKAKEALSSVLKSSFVGEKEPTHNQLVAVTRFMLKTDASALLFDDTYTMDEVLQLFKDPKYLAQQIRKYNKKLDIPNNSYYANNVEGLADLMVFGETKQNNSMLNAYFISILNDSGNKKDWKDLDIITSLLAIYKTAKAFESANEDLVKLINAETSANREVNGVTEMLLTHLAFKDRARKKNFVDGNGNVQHGLIAKGYIAKLHDKTHDLVVEPLKVPKKNVRGKVVKDANGKPIMIDNIEVMRKLGYEYQGKVPDIHNLHLGPMGLFVNKMVAEVGRTTGIASPTAKKAFGSSVIGMLAKNPLMKGQLKATIARINAEEEAKANKRNTKGAKANDLRTLIPIRNKTGKIVDYRIALKHDKTEEFLNQNLDAIEVMSTMESHLIDKASSEEINDYVVKLLTTDRKSMTNSKSNKWIDILHDDYREQYVTAFPKQMRKAIIRNATANAEGRLQFFVQERVLDAAFGFKQLSIGNILPDNRLKRVATLIEAAWKYMTSAAIVNVVVKIPAVGSANVTSNFIFALLQGMWPHKIVSSVYKTWRDLDRYQADVDELQKMVYRVQARPALLKDAKIKRKMQLLGNNIEKNRLHKFMSRGLFTSITEDIHVSEHANKKSLDSFIEERFGVKVPKTMITVAKHLYLDSSTKTGNFLVKFLQMTDFVFRVAIFEHRVNNSGWSEERAWKHIVKAFIPYDVPINKYAQYANDMSYMWFYRYWAKIHFVAFNEIRQRPANVLLYFFAQEAADIDSADIFDSSFVDGKFAPVDGGILKTLEELINPPAIEIASGKSL